MGSHPAERRRSGRIRLQVPIFVRGVDIHGHEFLDLTKTLDISAEGAFLAISRVVHANDLLSLTVPAPAASGGMLPPPNPPIRARVRRHKVAGNWHLLGVEFLKPLD